MQYADSTAMLVRLVTHSIKIIPALLRFALEVRALSSLHLVS